ncbi:MAG: acyl-CoA dehydrogenase family protein, partial [Comamonadaceae bacterium]
MIRDPERLAALVADIRQYVRERWHPLEDRVEREGAVPEDVVDELRRKGYFGWSIPEAYGGLGLTTEELVTCAFELSQA